MAKEKYVKYQRVPRYYGPRLWASEMAIMGNAISYLRQKIIEICSILNDYIRKKTKLITRKKIKNSKIAKTKSKQLKIKIKMIKV